MSVQDLNIIDAVSIDLNGNVVLSIADHLEWDKKNEHLAILQDKINLYLEAIEGGDLYKSYPNAKDRNIVIQVAAKYPPSKDGEVFLARIKETLNAAGYDFSFVLLSEEVNK